MPPNDGGDSAAREVAESKVRTRVRAPEQRRKRGMRKRCEFAAAAKDDAEATKLAAARRSAFSALARVSPTTILEDATVPRSELAHMVRFVEVIAKKYKLRVGTFGHMGDGNLHYNVQSPEGQDHREFQRLYEDKVNDIVYASVRRFGGSISAEHGIGVMKRDLLPSVKDPVAFDLMKMLKRQLDPKGVLNPGKVL